MNAGSNRVRPEIEGIQFQLGTSEDTEYKRVFLRFILYW